METAGGERESETVSPLRALELLQNLSETLKLVMDQEGKCSLSRSDEREEERNPPILDVDSNSREKLD